MTDKLMSETRVSVAPLWNRGGMTGDSTVRANAAGKSFHKAMTLVETTREFPDNKAAEAWIADLDMVGKTLPYAELTENWRAHQTIYPLDPFGACYR